jgi:hypothetical protein
MFNFSAGGKSWEPGIGDPTMMGWITVAAYFGASLLCLGAMLKLRRGGSGMGGPRLFWSILALLLLFLGFNKQLDLQTLFTVIGRRIALDGGWYDQRRSVQAVFVGSITILGAMCLAGLRALAGRTTKPVMVALAGSIFLGAFIVVRAASFHYVDQLLGWRFGGMKMNWVFELGGILLVGFGAFLQLRLRLPPVARHGPNFIWVTAGDRIKEQKNS